MYLLGSLFAPFLNTLDTNTHTPGVAKFAAKVVNVLLPNFAMFNTQNPIINPSSQITSESSYYMGAAVYGAIYIGILLVAGILIFDRREV